MPNAEKDVPIALPPAGPTHDCRQVLPWSSGGYGSTGYPEGAVALCTCGRAWVCLPCYRSLGPVTEWRQVRWFSRRDYRRRAAALRVTQPGDGHDL